MSNLPAVGGYAVVPVDVGTWSDAMVSAGATTGEYRDYLALTSATEKLLRAMPAEMQGSVAKGFEALPTAAQVVIGELFDNAPADALALTEDEVAEMAAECPVCAALAGEWGKASAYKFGFIRARTWRVVDRMVAAGATDADARALWRWIENLPAPAWMAIQRRLAEFDGAR